MKEMLKKITMTTSKDVQLKTIKILKNWWVAKIFCKYSALVF